MARRDRKLLKKREMKEYGTRELPVFSLGYYRYRLLLLQREMEVMLHNRKFLLICYKQSILRWKQSNQSIFTEVGLFPEI